MDHNKFQEAKQAYEAADYRAATKLFLAAADRGVAGNGAAYHMAANALMRLRRFPDAAIVYGHALRDDTYDRRGAVYVNLGQSLSAMGEYAQAAAAFESALAEPAYQALYKAWQGLAATLVERGRVDEAASAYHKAAVDPGNSDPGRALVNLGLCFMGLGRPTDAAEAYRAALGIEGYQARGKALSNLGMAYALNGEHTEAVRAFEKAVQLHGHRLSPSAQQTYEAVLASIRPDTEKVEGWETGDVSGAREVTPVADGWATGDLAALSGDSVPAVVGGADDVGSFALDASAAARDLGFGDAEAVTTYFSMTEDEMRVRDNAERRTRRAEGRIFASVARRIALVAVAGLLFAGAIGAAFWMGFGWPTQETTTKSLLEAYRAGEDSSGFWVAVPEKDIAKEMAKVPPVESFVVSRVERGAWTSAVRVTVTPKKGAALHYKVTLSREGVGWKVSGIDNDWRSTGG